MSSDPPLLPNAETWSPELRAALVTPEEFKNLTGIEFSEASKYQLIARRQRRRTPSQQRLWRTGTLIGHALFYTAILIVPVWAIAGLLRLFSVLTVQGSSVLRISLGIAGLLGSSLGIMVLGDERKAQRAIAPLFPLMDELERYHQILAALHVNERMTAIGAVEAGTTSQQHLLATATQMRENLIKAMQVERLLRENSLPQDFDPAAVAATLADSPSEQVLAQSKTYQDLLHQALEIGLAVQAEMKSLQSP